MRFGIAFTFRVQSKEPVVDSWAEENYPAGFQVILIDAWREGSGKYSLMFSSHGSKEERSG